MDLRHNKLKISNVCEVILKLSYSHLSVILSHPESSWVILSHPELSWVILKSSWSHPGWCVCMWPSKIILSPPETEGSISSPISFPIPSPRILTRTGTRDHICTGCPRKNALLCSTAYNSSLKVAIGTSRGSFQILRLSALTPSGR